MDMIIALSKKGVPIHIEDAQNGYHCECTCLRCGRPLNARQGGNNKWTFAHIPEKMEGVFCENTNSESDIHRYAKKLFCDKGKIYLPDIRIKDGITKRKTPTRNAKLEEIILEGADFNIEEAAVEEKLCLPEGGTMRPDVMLTIKGRKLAVEIVVTNDIDSIKRSGYISLEMSVLKIDLHGLVFKDMTKKELDEIILGNSTRKTWCFNEYAFEVNRKREEREQLEREAVAAREREQKEVWIKRMNAHKQQTTIKEIDKKAMVPAGYLQLNDFRPAEDPYRDWYLEWVPKCTHHERPQRMMLTYSHRTHQFFWSCREYPNCKRTVSMSEKPIKCPRCHKGCVEPIYIDAIRRNGFRCTNYQNCTFLFVDPVQPVR